MIQNSKKMDKERKRFWTRKKMSRRRKSVICTIFLQVWFGTIDFEMNYKSVPTETDAEIVGCGILSCMAIVTPLILIR